jgi:DNA polymerase III delta subunit
MALPAAWTEHPFALVHGEDGDGRREAVAAWRARHVDPEWADFSLTICAEGCPWPEVLAALQEAAPLGAEARCVIVPAADNLFTRAKELPGAIKALLEKPPLGVKLLLVTWTSLPAAPGKALGAKPWTDWAKAGRILKVGQVEHRDVPAFIEAKARELGLRLGGGGARLLQERLSNERVMGGRKKAEGAHPGILIRALEVLQLMADGAPVTEAMIDQTTFRMAGERAFAWKNAWTRGDAAGALRALREVLEDDPGAAPLQLLGQARGELNRIMDYLDATARGLTGSDLLEAIGFSPKQAFLLEGVASTAQRLKGPGLPRVVKRLNQAERDIKGMALGKSHAALLDLTLFLSRAWGG